MANRTQTIGFFIVMMGMFFATRGIVRGDIVVCKSGQILSGKIMSVDDDEIVIEENSGQTAQTNPPAATASRHVTQYVSRHSAVEIIHTDEHGQVVADPATTQAATRVWGVPAEPEAPPVDASPANGPTYYIVPLHGEVGSTIVARFLEKLLDDAISRKATVVVLDIDSPGGAVSEAKRILGVLERYNKRIRIVALADQDLSAAAIMTLSVKEIYVKPTSTIGAATAYIPGQPNLSPKVEEKMQSAWRAAARNSAEQGGHEPLLADAMIDNAIELHLETDISGKPVVKEGAGQKTLCHRGRILTLTSREAVNCGLAAGQANDLAELGQALGMPNWQPCDGIASAYAAYLPLRRAAFEKQIQKISNDLAVNLRDAISNDPTGEQTYIVNLGPRFVTPQPVPGSPMRPRYPGGVNTPGLRRPMRAYPPPVAVPQAAIVQVRTTPGEWKQRSLQCVVAPAESRG